LPSLRYRPQPGSRAAGDGYTLVLGIWGMRHLTPVIICLVKVARTADSLLGIFCERWLNGDGP
jgi:hypothetical protein